MRSIFYSAFVLLLSLSLRPNDAAISSKHLVHITEENWRQMLEGEWMLAFHAPWCPACKVLNKAWNAFADWGKDLNINVAEIDVTENPGLSGRFLITSLPTIYHINDGVFRLYAGPRDNEDFIWFVEEKKWQVVDSLPAWKNPDSVQMGIVAYFFKLSMSVRDLHTQLIEEHGIPPWGSYAIFAGSTLLLGSILGVVIVYFIDYLFPNKPPPAGASSQGGEGKKSKKEKKEKQKQQKNAAKADESKEKKSDNDASQNSQSDSQQSQSEGEEEQEKQRKGDAKKVANGKSLSGGQKKK